MYFYRVFGGVLSSEIDFPDLTPSAAETPDWTLTTARRAPALRDPQLVGSEALPGGMSARVERSGDVLRLSLDDTGTFDVSGTGTSIVWTPAPNASPALARSDLLGRVFALALHAAGDFCLHASAVAVDGRALVIVGEKGQGKSTLAMALVRAGCTLLADDSVRLTSDPVCVTGGVRALRLRGDSAARFGLDVAGLPGVPGEKVLVGGAPSGAGLAATTEWLPVEAIYLLAPRAIVVPDGGVARRRLGSLDATLALIRHGKAAALLGGEEAAAVLRRAAAVVRETPVFALDVARDLAAIERVAAQLVAWRGAA